jgi:hypothetical protein
MTRRSQVPLNRSRLAGLTLAAAMLFGAAPAAFAETTSSPVDGAWELRVVPDAAARLAGRDECDEFLTIDGFGFTGQEITRLGFNPSTPSTGMTAAGEITFTVALTSGFHGSWDAKGSFSADNNSMSGSLTWSKDGQTYNYTFTGVRTTPPPAEY